MSIVALTSDTLVASPGAGQIEYNGQFFGTDSNASRAQMQRLVQATSQASTSGTSIDFTGLPAWVKRITVMFSGVSTSGTSNPQVQLGSGSVTTSGYAGYNARQGATSNAYVAHSAGFIVDGSNTAATTLAGHLVVTLISGNTWICSGVTTNTASANESCTIAGSIALAGVLDRVRITTVNGTDTFDAGSINILYEG
jgi:hypothetical protein